MALKQKKVKKTTKSTKTTKPATPKKVVRKSVKSSAPANKTVSKVEKKPAVTFVTANPQKIQTAESWKRQKMQERKVK